MAKGNNFAFKIVAKLLQK